MGQEVDLRTDIYVVGIILWELLTQQRLFLGDTDYQTVKKVQDSVIPSISQINTKVPRELERILNKTLSREPAARYQTARELGQELARFLYTFGEPISTFDIAEIVTVAIRDREKVRAPQGSKIDKLIEEALFEFTSLRDDEDSDHPATQAEGVQPLDGNSFVDPTNWANELNLGADMSRSSSTLADSLPNLADGNLSALEDHDHDGLHVSSSPNPQGVGHNPLPQATPGAAGLSSALAPSTPAKGGIGAGVIGVVFALMLVAAAGAAYFGGFFGHK